MFGIKILTKRGLAEIKNNAKNQAVVDLIALLKQKDKIYIEPITLIGDNQTLENCAFIGISGNALTVIPKTVVNVKDTLSFY